MDPTVIDTLFAAAGLDGLSTNTQTLIVGLLGISVMGAVAVTIRKVLPGKL
ncbi:hypothetical protein [uncultured Desulfuromonas sp.]|uniref:hypothetical protein n=1 Tax=uncultured Desulfuromonas sp. TaxID=181013 RepID=UPI002AAC1FC4|nr:hypothetical protein [uncultured Desulfuromonas sp.]